MFFNKHMNIVSKNGGKKSKKKFYQKHTYIASKKDGKKSSGKSGKHVFYKYTNIVTKRRGVKKRDKFFPETHLYRRLKTMEKNRLEKVRKHVFL